MNVDRKIHHRDRRPVAALVSALVLATSACGEGYPEPPAASVGAPDYALDLMVVRPHPKQHATKEDASSDDATNRGLSEINKAATPTNQLIVDALNTVMSSPPWSLTTKKRDWEVIGTTTLRPSEILSGWYEQMTIRGDLVDLSRDESMDWILIEVSSTILISKQRVGAAEMTPLETGSQYQLMYEDVFHAAMKAELEKRCKDPRWWDAGTLHCDIPSGVEVPTY